MNNIKFEKVTYEQFKKDWLNTFPYKYSDELEESHVDNSIKSVYNDITLPKRGTAKSAGYDFVSPFGFELKPNETVMIPTGIKCRMADDMVLMIFPRSGLGTKFRFVPCNLVGIIDADYIESDNEGHIFMKMVNSGDKNVTIEKGKAFCQGIITKYFVTEDDDANAQRNGGFGSSDNK